MRLLGIETTNFKKLGTFSAEFTSGMNVIAGDNARGKSTLLQAIEAALFGVTVVPGKKENIPTWGQTKFSITLRFQLHDGNEFYTLVRTGTTAKLTRNWKVQIGEIKDPEIVANGSTPVTDMIEQLLGLTAKDWNMFVQSKQGSTAGILDFGAAALNRKVEQFAGVDLIDKVQAEAQRQATLNTSHADTTAVSEEVLAEAQAADTATLLAVKEATTQVTTAEKDLVDHGKFTAEKPASTVAMRQQQREVDVLSNNITLAEVKVANAEQRVTEAEQRTAGLVVTDLAALQLQLDDAKASGTELASKEKTLQTELATSKAAKVAADLADQKLDTRQAEHNAEWKDFEPDDSEAEIEKLVVSIQEAEAKLAGKLEEVGKAKAVYDNLSSLSEGATCPTCNRAKEDHDPVKLAAEAEAARDKWVVCLEEVNTLRSLVVTLTADSKGRLNTLDAYEASIVTLDAAITADKSAKEALKGVKAVEELEGLIESLAAELATSRGVYAEINARLKGATEARATYEREHQALNTTRTALEEAQSRLKALNDELDALPEPPTAEELEAAVKAETDYQEALTSFDARKQALTFAVTTAKSELRFQEQLQRTAKGNLQMLINSAAKSVEHATLAKKYARLVQFLRDRRQQYLKEVWDTIMGVATRLVRTASKDTITKVTNDEGDFYYEEDGVLAPTASASGAQKAMIGVSLRVGLARALYGKDSLLSFDEPGESCREHNAASLAAMIAGSAKQVLLITHRETDQALAQNIINVGE